MVHATVTLAEKPVQICIVSHWCDHLEGTKTAKALLRLTKASDGTIVEQELFGGLFERGDDGKYIHFEVLDANDKLVKMCDPGDKLSVCTICGLDGSYKELEEPDEDIEYEAEVRLFMFNLQLNTKEWDDTPPSAENKIDLMSDKENTDFRAMWPHLRNNLIKMGRLKKEDVTEPRLDFLWWQQPHPS